MVDVALHTWIEGVGALLGVISNPGSLIPLSAEISYRANHSDIAASRLLKIVPALNKAHTTLTDRILGLPLRNGRLNQYTRYPFAPMLYDPEGGERIWVLYVVMDQGDSGNVYSTMLKLAAASNNLEHLRKLRLHIKEYEESYAMGPMELPPLFFQGGNYPWEDVFSSIQSLHFAELPGMTTQDFIADTRRDLDEIETLPDVIARWVGRGCPS